MLTIKDPRAALRLLRVDEGDLANRAVAGTEVDTEQMDGVIEARMDVEQAVLSLPIELRAVAFLCGAHDMGQREAARLLGVDQSTVSRRFEEALRCLAEAL